MNTEEAVFNLNTAEGFELVYKTYSNKMYKIGYAKTGSKDITSEIIQDIFKSVWERKNTLRINVSVENYLMRALKFKIIDHYRSATVVRRGKREILENYVDRTHTTEEDIAYNELKEKVDCAVDKLSSKCKKVYQLSREQGYSNKQIAEDLLISERAVAYHISNAMTNLKKDLSFFYKPQFTVKLMVFILLTAGL